MLLNYIIYNKFYKIKYFNYHLYCIIIYHLYNLLSLLIFLKALNINNLVTKFIKNFF